MNSRQIRIAVTGGIGCGKSEAGRMLEEAGVAVCDTDDIARALLEPGEELFNRVVEYFGRDVLQSDGRLDRGALAQRVFRDEEKRSVLNEMMHPVIGGRWRDWARKKREQGRDVAVLIPLLYETGEQRAGWDAVLCVTASPELVWQRLRQRGMRDEDIAARIASQMPLNEKEERADFVIRNEGTREDLRCRTNQVLQAIRKEKGHNG
jgi:dephospho-CoA kinase